MITARRHEADTDLALGTLLLFGGFYLQISAILYPSLKIRCWEYNNEARHCFVCYETLHIRSESNITIKKLFSTHAINKSTE